MAFRNIIPCPRIRSTQSLAIAAAVVPAQVLVVLLALLQLQPPIRTGWEGRTRVREVGCIPLPIRRPLLNKVVLRKTLCKVRTRVRTKVKATTLQRPTPTRRSCPTPRPPQTCIPATHQPLHQQLLSTARRSCIRGRREPISASMRCSRPPRNDFTWHLWMRLEISETKQQRHVCLMNTREEQVHSHFRIGV